MAYFALLDENNIVINVIVISNDDMIDENGDESEAHGVAVCESVVGPGRWLQTSFNNTIRGTFAAVGYSYDENADRFVVPSPYPSWSLNDQYDWEAPTPYPSDGGAYTWNEEQQTWDMVLIEEPAP